MQITVLGTGAAFPRPGSACSGFLVRTDSTTVWLEAGNGTFGRLLEHVNFTEVDAVVVSHSHPDHTADIVPLMYALGYDAPEPGHMTIHAPPDVRYYVNAQLGEQSQQTLREVFTFTDIDGPFDVGDLHFEPFLTRHPVETYGFRISDTHGLVVYTADTAVFPELAEHCRGADILIAEATYVKGVEAPPDIHLWGEEAGRLAKEAGARRMLLTHTWGSIPLESAVREAAAAWDGPVEAAQEGKTYMP